MAFSSPLVVKKVASTPPRGLKKTHLFNKFTEDSCNSDDARALWVFLRATKSGAFDFQRDLLLKYVVPCLFRDLSENDPGFTYLHHIHFSFANGFLTLNRRVDKLLEFPFPKEGLDDGGLPLQVTLKDMNCKYSYQKQTQK